MVNIFGMKLFESPSMEEQMHHKGRHGHNCECPNCSKKKYRGRHGHNCECPNCLKKKYRHSNRRHKSRSLRSRSLRSRSLRGGYTYKQNNKSMKEEDVTMELSNVLSGSKSMSKSKARGTRRRNH